MVGDGGAGSVMCRDGMVRLTPAAPFRHWTHFSRNILISSPSIFGILSIPPPPTSPTCFWVVNHSIATNFPILQYFLLFTSSETSSCSLRSISRPTLARVALLEGPVVYEDDLFNTQSSFGCLFFPQILNVAYSFLASSISLLFIP